MRKPTALTVMLALLVVLPSGVLAWLGLKSADAFEQSELQRLRTDVALEADRWRDRGDAARFPCHSASKCPLLFHCRWRRHLAS